MGIKLGPEAEWTHNGLVLRLGEHNGYHDSDFYAWVWNEAKGAPDKIEYATTRFPCEGYTAVEDATPEVVAKWEAWSRANEERRQAAELEKRKEAIKARAKAPAKGAPVTVVKGRKVPKGTKGECFWIGESRFGTRVGIKDAAGTVHWTAATNVECDDWETVYKRLLEKAGIPA